MSDEEKLTIDRRIELLLHWAELRSEMSIAEERSIESMREISNESGKAHAAAVVEHDRQIKEIRELMAGHAAQMKEIREVVQSIGQKLDTLIQNIIRREDGRRS